MSVRIATKLDIACWAKLRANLWKDTSYDQHIREINTMLAKPSGEFVCFLDVRKGDSIRAFAEVALRRDYVNGCGTSPVAFLEGIYVKPEYQASGIGRNLLMSVQSWAREQGCTELASDTNLDNLTSHAFHEALGFEETERVIYFRKLL